MNRFNVITLPVLLATSLFLNQQLFSQSGESGATGLAFLKIGAGAKASAMGNAYAAVTQDATATYWNPAALGTLPGTHISFSHTEWLQDISHEFLAVTFPAFGGGVGFSFYGISVDGLERRTTASTEPIGTFQANNLAAAVSYGRALTDGLNLGVSAKYLYEKTFTESAPGYAFDFALNYRLNSLPINLAVVAQNFGSMKKFRFESSKLPALIRIGGSYQLDLAILNGHLIVSTEAVKVFDAENWISLGTELLVKKYLLLRLGYQNGIEDRGIAAGFGLQLRRYQLDFGFTPFGSNLGQAQKFSISVIL